MSARLPVNARPSLQFGRFSPFWAYGNSRKPTATTLPHMPPESVPDCSSSNVSGERRSLQDALAHERNVLRTMIDLIPAFIYAKDAQSRFTARNKLGAARMGVTPEAAVGKSDFDFFAREMAEKFFADE